MKPKVLVAAPNRSSKNYCLVEHWNAVRALREEHWISDNTPGDENAWAYKALGIDYGWCNPEGKDRYQALTDSQNAIRERFLSGDYTHLMFLETDLFPDANVVKRLLLHKKPVVGHSYFLFSGHTTKPMYQEMSRNEGSYGVFIHSGVQEAFYATNGNLQQVDALGFGCVLIEREILEELEFRCRADEYTQGEGFADSFFYTDLARYKVPVFADTSCMVRHWNQDWVKTVEKPNIFN